MKFKTRFELITPLLLCNVWDAASAKIAERLNFDAIGTSSGAMAEMLGYADGEVMTFSELIYLVERIVSAVNIPVTVDLEGGYSRDAHQIVEHIAALYEIGVVGVNIEDSVVSNGRSMLDVHVFAKVLTDVKSILSSKQIEIFINVRTDGFLMGVESALNETINRSICYEQAGADGIFIPCIVRESDIKQIVTNLSIPVNVMCMPDLPNFRKLHEIGVQRISMGDFIFNDMLKNLEAQLSTVITSQSFNSIFAL